MVDSGYDFAGLLIVGSSWLEFGVYKKDFMGSARLGASSVQRLLK